MKGRVIIYGATGSVGSAIASLMAEQDRPLHLVARNERRLSELAENTRAECTAGDVRDTELFARVMKDLDGPCVALIYAIGTLRLGSLRQVEATGLNEALHINAVAPALAIQAAVPAFRAARQQASVVLFSSLAAQKGLPRHTEIGMAKAAVEGLTRSLAAELAPRVRVNAIAPSLMRTALTADLISDAKMEQSLAKAHPMQRLGQAEDVAELAAFLVSERAAWMTGQILGVDGGRSTLIG